MIMKPRGIHSQRFRRLILDDCTIWIQLHVIHNMVFGLPQDLKPEGFMEIGFVNPAQLDFVCAKDLRVWGLPRESVSNFRETILPYRSKYTLSLCKCKFLTTLEPVKHFRHLRLNGNPIVPYLKLAYQKALLYRLYSRKF